MNYGSFRTRKFTDHPKSSAFEMKIVTHLRLATFIILRRCVVYMKVVVRYQKLQNIAHALSYLSKLSIMINAQ